jgi:hypothetical protein
VSYECNSNNLGHNFGAKKRNCDEIRKDFVDLTDSPVIVRKTKKKIVENVKVKNMNIDDFINSKASKSYMRNENKNLTNLSKKR